MNVEMRVCTKCGEEKELSENFYPNGISTTGEQYYIWECKECKKEYAKEYREKNKEELSEKNKTYREKNKEEIKEKGKKYSEENKEKIKKYREGNKEEINEKGKKYREENKEKIKEKGKIRREKNRERISEKKKIWHEEPALYKTFAHRLTVEEDPKDAGNGYLLVKCTYCGKYFSPTNLAVQNRIAHLSRQGSGEGRLYCSDGCKDACPIYHQKKWPKGFKPATSREVDPLIRQMCLKRDDYTCQECGATTDEAELHAHHWIGATAYPTLANDVVDTTTFCVECHEWIHTEIDGCKYSEMTCEAVRAKYAEKP